MDAPATTVSVANNFSRDELMLIIAALWTVSPTGGGSEQFTLYRKVVTMAGHDIDLDLLERLSQRMNDVVLAEAKGRWV